MKKYTVLFITLMMLMSLVGCEQQVEESVEVNTSNQTNQNATGNTTQETTSVLQGVTGENDAVLLTFPTDDYLEDLSMDQAYSFSDQEEIYICESGTYLFSGSYTNQTIVVNVDKEVDEGVVYLVLDNVNMTSTNATPIYVYEAKDVVIVLEGTNTISQSNVTTTDEEFPSAAIYTKADTVITGDGSLSVVTDYQDGINSRDDLIISSTTISVNAIEDGIVGKDLLAVSNSTISIEAGKDGLKTSNDEDEDKGHLMIQSGTYYITADGDAISAENTLQIEGGDFDLTSGGGFVKVLNSITVGEGSGNYTQSTDLLETSMKGLKGFNIIIQGGTINISAYEDGIHANNDLHMTGGTVVISSGDDAVHADDTLVIDDGSITVTTAYEGIEADYVIVNGGTIWVSVLDDAMNAGSSNGYILITGGEIYLTSSGDGIDSNGDLYIEGGNLVIDNNAIYTGGDGEIDVTGTMSISGGTIVDGNGNAIDTTQQLQGGMQSSRNDRFSSQQNQTNVTQQQTQAEQITPETNMNSNTQMQEGDIQAMTPQVSQQNQGFSQQGNMGRN